MTTQEKYQGLKAFLQENSIAYEENKKDKDVTLPLCIPHLRIVIHPGDDQGFYQKVKRKYKPLFIREEDSMDFVMEKAQNLIIERMTKLQEKYERDSK